MNDIETVLRYNELLSLYQNLLSKTQKEILEDYFFYNLSFSEIAENRKISRSAVEDAIKKALKKLDDFEKELKVLEKNEKILELVAKAKDASGDEKIQLLEEVERIIYSYGI